MLPWCGLGEATKRAEGFKAETRTSLFLALQAEVGRWKPFRLPLFQRPHIHAAYNRSELFDQWSATEEENKCSNPNILPMGRASRFFFFFLCECKGHRPLPPLIVGTNVGA